MGWRVWQPCRQVSDTRPVQVVSRPDVRTARMCEWCLCVGPVGSSALYTFILAQPEPFSFAPVSLGGGGGVAAKCYTCVAQPSLRRPNNAGVIAKKVGGDCALRTKSNVLAAGEARAEVGRAAGRAGPRARRGRHQGKGVAMGCRRHGCAGEQACKDLAVSHEHARSNPKLDKRMTRTKPAIGCFACRSPFGARAQIDVVGGTEQGQSVGRGGGVRRRRKAHSCPAGPGPARASC